MTAAWASLLALCMALAARVGALYASIKRDTAAVAVEFAQAATIEEAAAAGWRVGKSHQNATAMMIVSVAVLVVIGVFVVAEVNDAIPSISNSNLSTGRTDVIGGFGDALALMAVFFVVAVASLILNIVQGL